MRPRFTRTNWLAKPFSMCLTVDTSKWYSRQRTSSIWLELIPPCLQNVFWNWQSTISLGRIRYPFPRGTHMPCARRSWDISPKLPVLHLPKVSCLKRSLQILSHTSSEPQTWISPCAWGKTLILMESRKAAVLLLSLFVMETVSARARMYTQSLTSWWRRTMKNCMEKYVSSIRL